MSFGTMFTILFTWYFQSLGINLGFLPTALLALPFGISITILYVLIKDKLVFSYYRTQKSPPVMLLWYRNYVRNSSNCKNSYWTL